MCEVQKGELGVGSLKWESIKVFRRNVCNSDEFDVRKSYSDLSTMGKFLCGSVLRIIALHIALCGLVSSHAQINILMSQFFFQPQKNHSPTLKPPGFKNRMRNFLSSSFSVHLFFSLLYLLWTLLCFPNIEYLTNFQVIQPLISPHTNF